MFTDLGPYGSYGEQQVGWLPPAPAHWTRVRFRNVLRERDRRSTSGDEQLLRVSQFTGVTERLQVGGEADTRAASLVGHKKVELDDLVVNIMLAWNGSLGVSRYVGIVSPAYCVYSFSAASDPWYYHCLLRTPEYRDRIKALSTGVVDSRLRLYTDDLYGLEALVPPIAEQAAIVKYLTHAHARIDRAIAAKRRLGLLIDEQRQAMTRRLLTCTSDGDPANWQYVPAGHLCKITTGVEDSGNAVPDGEYPFYVRGREILRASDYIMDAEAVMTPGDGQGGVGKVFHYFNGKFQAHQRVYIFSDFDGVDGRFFYWHLSSFFRRFALSQSNTVTMESLRLPVLASFPVAVPSLSVQRKIVSRIEAEDARAHAVRLTVQREIELLREFRMRLTSDVVTGQLDVRHIAATLPDLDPAVEPGDVDASDDDLLDDADEPLEEVDA